MNFATFNRSIPRKLSQFFIIDHLPDAMPLYDKELNEKYLILDDGKAKFDNGFRIEVPLSSTITEKHILNFLKEACKYASSHKNIDIPYWKAIYNIKSDIPKIWHLFEKYLGYVPYFGREGDEMSIYHFDFVPINCIYLMPEPEFFGCIPIRCHKIGAFCLPQNIVKVEWV